MVGEIAIGGLAWLAGSVSAGVVGNVSDRMVCGLLRGFTDRIAGISELPENHDLGKAIRTAQIQALERLIQDYAEGPRRDAGRLLQQTDAFISRVKAFCREAIGRCLRWEVTPSGVQLTKALLEAVETILSKPISDTSEARVAAIAKLAEDAVLRELAAVSGDIEIPEDFITHLRTGSGPKPRFLELFGVYVVEQLKHNVPFRSIFMVGQLSRLESMNFEGRGLVERLEEVFSSKLTAIEAFVGVLEQRAETSEVAIRTQRLSVDAIRAGVDRLLSDSRTRTTDIQTVLTRLGEANARIDQLPEQLAAILERHIWYRESQLARSQIGGWEVKPRAAKDAPAVSNSSGRFDRLDDVAAWLTSDHHSRWSSRWLDSLAAFRAQGQIDDHDYRRVLSHVIDAPFPDDAAWATLEHELHNQGALSRSLMQVPASSLYASLRLERGAGRLVQMLTALRLGIRISVTVKRIDFVMVPPGSLVTRGASEPLINYTPYFVSRSPVDEPTWSRLVDVEGNTDIVGKPKTTVSITEVQRASSKLSTAALPGTITLPSAEELTFAFDADEYAVLGLLHPVEQLWHLCSRDRDAARVQVVRPRKFTPPCTLEWPNDAARHRDVGFRLVFRPQIERI